MHFILIHFTTTEWGSKTAHLNKACIVQVSVVGEVGSYLDVLHIWKLVTMQCSTGEQRGFTVTVYLENGQRSISVQCRFCLHFHLPPHVPVQAGKPFLFELTTRRGGGKVVVEELFRQQRTECGGCTSNNYKEAFEDLAKCYSLALVLSTRSVKRILYKIQSSASSEP